jgi:hypothetical protein
MADRCEARLATPCGKMRCTRDAKYLFRRDREGDNWKKLCGQHARVTSDSGERKPLPATGDGQK